jgi:hypothetical protein
MGGGAGRAFTGRSAASAGTLALANKAAIKIERFISDPIVQVIGVASYGTAFPYRSTTKQLQAAV